MDEASGIALALRGRVPTYQVEDSLPRRSLRGGGRKAELTYYSTFQLRKMEVTTDGVSGGRIMQPLIRGRFFEGALIDE
jgi:hypothetical protein